jgi:hypothetical protein
MTFPYLVPPPRRSICSLAAGQSRDSSSPAAPPVCLTARPDLDHLDHWLTFLNSFNRVPLTQLSMEIPIPSYTPPSGWFLRIEPSASRASPGATLTFNRARVVQDEQRVPLVIVDFKFTLSSNASIRSTPAVRLEIGGIPLDTKCYGSSQQTSIAAASLPWRSQRFTGPLPGNPANR